MEPEAKVPTDAHMKDWRDPINKDDKSNDVNPDFPVTVYEDGRVNEKEFMEWLSGMNKRKREEKPRKSKKKEDFQLEEAKMQALQHARENGLDIEMLPEGVEPPDENEDDPAEAGYEEYAEDELDSDELEERREWLINNPPPGKDGLVWRMENYQNDVDAAYPYIIQDSYIRPLPRIISNPDEDDYDDTPYKCDSEFDDSEEDASGDYDEDGYLKSSGRTERVTPQSLGYTEEAWAQLMKQVTEGVKEVTV